MKKTYTKQIIFSVILILVMSLLSWNSKAREDHVSFERIFRLKKDEGVFAYSRISPDGKLLAYASEVKVAGKKKRTINVVDLATKKVIFSEPGIDAYFSPDGTRMIYESSLLPQENVSIWHLSSGAVSRDVASSRLGDYYSWGFHDGKDLILTIDSNYFYLNHDKGELVQKVPECADIGRGERPLLSKDGKRLSTFVKGNLVIRNLDNCENIFNTETKGAKADFSFDGRYIAFHLIRENGKGYDIAVIDLEEQTVRNLTKKYRGSSFFPSFTEDGRLSFRYDGPEYRGFMMATNVLSVPASPLFAEESVKKDSDLVWQDIFTETPLSNNKFNLILVWSPWGAHSIDALSALKEAKEFFKNNGQDVNIAIATDAGSNEVDIENLLKENGIDLARIFLSPERIILTQVNNQNPAYLLFKNGQLIDRKLGAQSLEDLKTWVSQN